MLGRVLGALALNFVFRYAQNYLMQMIGQKVMYDMRVQIFSHLQRQSLAYFDRNPVGRLISRLTNDVDALNEFIRPGVVAIAGDLVALVGIVIVHAAARLAAGAGHAGGAAGDLSRQPAVPALDARAPIASSACVWRRVNAFLQENCRACWWCSCSTARSASSRSSTPLNTSYLDANLDAVRLFAALLPDHQLLVALAMALLIWYGSGRILAGVVSLGVLVAFFQYTDRTFLPIRDLAEKYNIMQAAMASAERIFMLLDEPATINGSVRSPAVGDGARRHRVPPRPFRL